MKVNQTMLTVRYAPGKNREMRMKWIVALKVTINNSRLSDSDMEKYISDSESLSDDSCINKKENRGKINHKGTFVMTKIIRISMLKTFISI